MWEGMHTQLPGTGAREDEYQLLRSIGSGSFGQVFLVLHKEENREFVMKSIDLHSASDDGRQQMELEVQLLRTMQHPNIVAYRDSFIDRTGHLCILMEYCEHGDIFTYLQEVRRTNSAPEEGRLLEWFTHIVWALQSLHQQKILHRDLKTQNIFLTGNRQQNILAAKLGDFGIAKVLTSTADLAKTQIGTPFYMSPELINSHPYSYKSDVWGLGCVLYEVVNGHRVGMPRTKDIPIRNEYECSM
ncbi:NEK4 [Symbiodinium natans]|uniref:non-specific serine/threonine protein kinase n=1 Tax=Symbiodinium natans TaxID=878477 RepID=A0A812SAL5_9DINO|nr:NEK4 [Symbiodinium natans]